MDQLVARITRSHGDGSFAVERMVKQGEEFVPKPGGRCGVAWEMNGNRDVLPGIVVFCWPHDGVYFFLYPICP